MSIQNTPHSILSPARNSADSKASELSALLKPSVYEKEYNIIEEKFSDLRFGDIQILKNDSDERIMLKEKNTDNFDTCKKYYFQAVGR
jgi:hypothetical protein